MARSAPRRGPDQNRSEADIQESVTELVKLLLEQQGPKKTELAQALGITPDNLSHTLSPPERRRRAWKISDIRGLARHYEISIDVLIGDDPDGRAELLDELRYEAEQRISRKFSDAEGNLQT